MQLLGGVEATDLLRLSLAQNLSQVRHYFCLCSEPILQPFNSALYMMYVYMHNSFQSERVREAVRRLLSSDSGDCWILNTAFIVDDFSFVESVTVSLLDWIAS